MEGKENDDFTVGVEESGRRGKRRICDEARRKVE